MLKRWLEITLDLIVVLSFATVIILLAILKFGANHGYVGSTGQYNLNNLVFMPITIFVVGLILLRFVPNPKAVTVVIKNLGLDYWQRKTKSRSKTALVLNILIILLVALQVLFATSMIYSRFQPGTYECEGQLRAAIKPSAGVVWFEVAVLAAGLGAVLGLIKIKALAYKIIIIVLLVMVIALQFFLALGYGFTNSCFTF